MKIQHTLFSLIGLFASNVLLAQNWEKSINIYNQTTFYETTVFQGTTGQNGSIATESTHKAIQYLKPKFLYKNDGSIREFGIGTKNKTILPIWLLSIVLGILCYLFVIYYIAFSY